MTVNIGVIGVGRIGQDHARRLAQVTSGCQVVAVADVDTDRARALAASLPEARALPTGEEVIAAPDVDALVVATSGPTHERYVLGSIAAGKPVFCEKPLTPTQEASLRIVEAEVASGRRLVQVGFMRRYDDGYRSLKRVLDSGTIGTPLLAHCVHRNRSSGQGFTSDMLITDSGVHEVDVVRWLFDEEITRVAALSPRRSSRAAAGLADPRVLLLETASGAHVDVEVFVNCDYGYDIRCEVVAETGTVELASPTDVVTRRAGERRAAVELDWPTRFARAYDTELREWVDSVARDEPRGPSAWDGYAAAVTCEALVRAAATGQREPVVMKDRPPFYGER